jgi:hypothetical protein
MDNSYYVSPKPSWFMREIWKASGADPQLLRRSTYTDQLKYFCVGSLIYFTALFGFMSGAYAFYAVFQLDITPDKSFLDVIYLLLSLIFGLIWGWFIFSFNRFLYISSSKGDGTEAITFREFVNAIPKLFLSITLSAFISIPLAVGLSETQAHAIESVIQGDDASENITKTKFEHFNLKLKSTYSENMTFALSINVFFAIVSLTPFLLRLMLVKGPYEHMLENIEKLSKAELGIEVIYDYYEDQGGKRTSKVINHPVEYTLNERKKILDAQRRINDKIIQAYMKTKGQE